MDHEPPAPARSPSLKVLALTVAVLVAGACAGTDTVESPPPSRAVTSTEPATTTITRAAPAPTASTTTEAAESRLPDPCALLSVAEAADLDATITRAEEPAPLANAETRTCDMGALTITVGPGGPDDSLLYEGMEEDGVEPLDITVHGADAALAYASGDDVWQVAAVDDEHTVTILLWSAPVSVDSPELDGLVALLETAFGRLDGSQPGDG